MSFELGDKRLPPVPLVGFEVDQSRVLPVVCRFVIGFDLGIGFWTDVERVRSGLEATLESFQSDRFWAVHADQERRCAQSLCEVPYDATMGLTRIGGVKNHALTGFEQGSGSFNKMVVDPLRDGSVVERLGFRMGPARGGAGVKQVSADLIGCDGHASNRLRDEVSGCGFTCSWESGHQEKDRCLRVRSGFNRNFAHEWDCRQNFLSEAASP